METVEKLLERLVPKEIKGPATIDTMTALRDAVKRELPRDTSVEVVEFFGTLTTTVRLPGDRPHVRTTKVIQ